MRYILLILFLTFGMGCQTMKAEKQARKGWKRVDKEWFGMQAKAPVPQKAATRTPASSGEFMCESFLISHGSPPHDAIKLMTNWVNGSCDSNKNFSTFSLEGFKRAVACCFQK